MRKGWEYKKLGDCFSYIKNGANIKQKKDADGFPITRIETLSGGVFNRDRMGYAGIHDLSKYADYVLESKDLLMSHINSKTYIGRTVEYKGNNEEAIIHGMNLLRLKAIHELIDSTFFAYYTQSGDFKSKIARIRKDAVNQSSFAISDLKRFDIPLPPKSTQLAIVSELDKINELIRLKKEQLKDFDNLAQSLFYEMFGDPVENEKGWEVKKLGEICEIFAGGDKPKDMCEIQNNEYIYPVIANGEGEKGILGYTKNCRVTKEAVTIGARGASIGNCRIVKNGFTPAIRLLTLIPTGSIDCCFLYYFVKDLNYKQNGAGQAQLTVPNIKCEFIPLPPLSLQRLFAQRIEQIEREKSEVQKSIQDLETLLASRMQYWFE
jgi:type I restriction enzyme S subunit